MRRPLFFSLSLSLVRTDLSPRVPEAAGASRLVERVSAARASVARGRDGCNVIVVRCGAGHPVVRACVRACVPARPRACPRIVVACPSCNPTLNPEVLLFRDSSLFLFLFLSFTSYIFPSAFHISFTPSFYPPTLVVIDFRSECVRACVFASYHRFHSRKTLANFRTGLRARAPLLDVRFARRTFALSFRRSPFAQFSLVLPDAPDGSAPRDYAPGKSLSTI